MIIIQRRVAGLTAESLDRFLLRARKALRMKGQVDVLITSNSEIRSLNRQFRQKNKATDVLSFPSAAPRKSTTNFLIGEIAISADTAAQNAVRLGHPVALEVKILALHGILHLAGFDHERDNGEMARKELELRRKLHLPTGLIERATTTAKLKPQKIPPALHARSKR